MSRDEAQRTLRRLKAEEQDTEAHLLNIYRCRHCHRWHVGHSHSGTPRLVGTPIAG